MRVKFTVLIILLCWLGLQPAVGQRTVGVLSSIDSLQQGGLNLFYPHNQSSVFLMDNCGRKVNEWTDDASWRPGNSAYLLEDGRLVKAKRSSSITGDRIWAGGGGAIIEIRGWDNTLQWRFELNDSLFRLHHDFVVMPNGNILMISWELKNLAESIAAGRDTSLLDEDEIWSEYLLEVRPIGADSFEVVWEWHAWDHLIQDYDSTKANYGVVADHPELINLNHTGVGGGEADWLHFNSLDYNDELNQLLISCPEFNEIWIIDHSTTTAQAATSSGGFSGVGGDLMFRWGNPMTYGNGDSTDIQLGYQHDAHWMDVGLNNSNPDFGKIILFNNRIGADFSTVITLQPDFDTYEWEYRTQSNGQFRPAQPASVYTRTPAQDMYSNILSSAQRLQNGNTLICVGRPGYSFEVTPSGQVVWEYRTPLDNGTPVSQGDTLDPGNFTFKMIRYPADYAAFNGRTLIAGDYIELNPDTTLCNYPTVGVRPPSVSELISFYPNPSSDMLFVEFEGSGRQTISLFDLRGVETKRFSIESGRNALNVSDLSKGMYLLHSEGDIIGKIAIMR